jgi:hypothetical protein
MISKRGNLWLKDLFIKKTALSALATNTSLPMKPSLIEAVVMPIAKDGGSEWCPIDFQPSLQREAWRERKKRNFSG